MTSELHLPLVLPLVISGIEITFVLLLTLLSRAPGWGALRALILSGLSAAVYTFVQLPFAVPGVSHDALSVCARIANAAASANAISWLWYIRYDRTPARSTRFERLLGIVLGIGGALSLVPGKLVVAEVIQRPFTFFLMDVRPGPVIDANTATVIAGYLCVFWHYLREAQRRAPGARATSAAFTVFLIFAVHEACVIVGLYEAPYAIGIGFLVLMFARAGIVARRVADDAALRLRLSLDLESKVTARTSELVRVKEALMQKERLAALGQLAAGVGHEINNPLTYVLGNLEILMNMDPPLSPDALQIVDEALDGAERVRKIVRDLRALGKGSAGDRAEPMRLAEAATGAHKLIVMQLRSKNVSVEIDADDSVAKVDRGRLGQVLVNLLTNAAAALPAEIVEPERRIISMKVARDGSNVKLTVQDRGVGIKKEDLLHVFEPFFTTRTDSGGTGLGLYVSHSVVSSYGGTLTVESVQGKGTTVTITLPRCEDLPELAFGDVTPAPLRMPTPTPTPMLPLVMQTPTERVLVVDDDAPVARAMARLLSSYAVDVANDVPEAKVLLGKHSYAAVVCDLRMTGASGMVLFGHLRATNPRLARRFMLVTGGGLSAEERAELDDFGAPILTKPVEGAELRQNVKQLTTR
jgi:signal transduction histidine kinase/CheY-like chemotaxis protein